MKIIVNVEDVGLHPAVERAVGILKEKGIVTACSIKANEKLAGVPMELAGLDIGIHLDILRGRPLRHWQHVATICDENGSFHSNPAVLFQQYAMGKVDHAHVEMEWREQIESVLGLGITATHLTSYKHVHGWPSLAKIAASLAKEYGIDWIRKPEECSEIAKLDKSGFPSKFQNVCGFFDRETDGVGWTDWMWSSANGKSFTPDAFVLAVQNEMPKNAEIIELRCRPGILIGGDAPIPHYAGSVRMALRWQTDYKSLTEHDWREVLNRKPFALSGFSELVA